MHLHFLFVNSTHYLPPPLYVDNKSKIYSLPWNFDDTLNANNNNDNENYTGYSGKASSIVNVNGVINLSSVDLTQAQLNLLSKGLNFCPTPGKLHSWEIKVDLERLHRSLRLKHFFKKQNAPPRRRRGATQTPSTSQPEFTSIPAPDGVPQKLFRSTSTWNPTQAHKNIETFATVNFSQTDKIPALKPKFHNLPKAEKLAISELLENTDILIKPADKGAGVVVMNTKDYIFEAKRQLYSDAYEPSNKDYIQHAALEVKKVLYNLLATGSINKRRHSYLSPTIPKPGKFYLLPKIHKLKLPPPGRPIVSQIGSPTEKISGYLDFFLQPFLQKIPSYIKDTGHFLHIIQTIGEIPQNSLLVTLDVTSLYTNIPINEAKIAVAKALFDLRGTNSTPTNQQLLQLLDLILKFNIFTFSTGTELLYFLQIIGIAMGTKAAVAIANIFMHFFEDKHIFKNDELLKPILYKRFIDDIFMIWTHGPDTLNNFIQHLNTVHPTIKFTANISKTDLEFLDTKVTLHNGQLTTELFTKSTNAQAYLLRSSYHPRHTFTSLPYGEFLRTRRNCSNLTSFDIHAKLIYTAFQKRGYETDLLDQALNKARAKDRDSLFIKYTNPDLLNQAFLDTQTEPTQPQQSTFYFITKYHDEVKQIQKIIRGNWDHLGKSPETEHLYDSKLVTGYRKNTNLKGLLVKTQIPLTTPNPGISGKIIRDCPDPENCTLCPRFDSSGKITSFKTKKSCYSRTKATCLAHNIIYGIQCNTCGKQYVGQTKRNFSVRFREHTNDLSKNNLNEIDQPVAIHLTRPDHTGSIDQITCFVLDFIKSPSHSDRGALERNDKERIWIHRLGTLRPHGLNTMEPKPFLKPVTRD